MTSTPKGVRKEVADEDPVPAGPDLARAARTNSFCFSVVSWPRTMRAVVSQLAMLSATTIVQKVAVPPGLRISVVDRKGQVGEAVERVEQPHEDVVDESAHETGDGAVDDAGAREHPPLGG
jgi:hypothetical protein